MTKNRPLDPLTMTDQELIAHASKQVQALRMALDMIECEKYERRHVRWAIIDALKEEALAQPEQETEEQRLLRRKWFGHRDTEHLSFAEAIDTTMEKLYSQPEQWEDRWGCNHYADQKEAHPVNAKPLYTTPPQRKWVGLTAEERLDIWTNTATPMLIAATEAKLKEKNT